MEGAEGVKAAFIIEVASKLTSVALDGDVFEEGM